ncbi:hypothetical protein [Nitrosopumilus sp.]|uniref:hypothetical protein n=1 Tax=Nitrosopumilus sp. TaxID=2024843 RepID=UPI003D147EB8
MSNVMPIWSKDNKAGIQVVKTDQKLLKGKHKGEYMWKVIKGDEFLIVDQQEALRVEEFLNQNPLLRESQEKTCEEHKDSVACTCN